MKLSMVHLWHLDPQAVRDIGLVERCRSMMSADEKSRERRFAFEKDRHTFVVSRGLLRTVLSALTDVDPARWVFRADPYGKPRIVEPDGLEWLRFSLSHTSGMVACGITRGCDLGVDAEDIERPVPAGELARQYFSAAEAADVLGRPTGEQPGRFYDYWTLKEAYVKARGLGFSLPLAGFTFKLSTCEPTRITFGPGIDDRGCDWQFAQLMPTPHHKVAVAVRGGAGPDLEIAVHQGLPDPGAT